MSTAYTLTHYGPDQAAEIRHTLLDVHADAYSDAAEAGDRFHDQERFAWFVDHWSALPGFTCVIAHDGDEPAGYAYGAPAADGREWWREHLSPTPEQTATFSLSELMVRPKWRKTGLADQLHTALLDQRPEPLTALLVDTTHPRVQALYETWGYRKVGEQQPFADSPLYAVMIHGLPDTSTE